MVVLESQITMRLGLITMASGIHHRPDVYITTRQCPGYPGQSGCIQGVAVQVALHPT
jgi:hypothetical protein